MNDIPWTNWEEWRNVYSMLYSHSYEQKKRASYFCAMWNLRGLLPLPVRCTWDLVEAQLLDMTQSSQGGPSSEQVRLCYASAIIRLVNLATEDGQRGEFAFSVSQLAQKVGLPKWIVDVRHDCSHHNTMSSLSVLRLTSAQVLAWLRTEYWELQLRELHREEKNDFLTEQVLHLAKLLNESTELRRESGPQLPSLSDNQKGDSSEEVTQTTTAQDILENIRDFELSRLAQALHSAMVQHGSKSKFELWQKALQWLDGPGTFRVSRPIVLLCFRHAIADSFLERNLEIARFLLSRTYCGEKREYLCKYKKKQLNLDAPHEWSPEERAFMSDFAPDMFQKELRVIAKQCLLAEKPSALVVLHTVVIPSLQSHGAFRKLSDKFTIQLKLLADIKEKCLWGNADPSQSWLTSTIGLELEKLEEFCHPKDDGKEHAAAGLSPSLHHDRTLIADLEPEGRQEWTRVQWIKGQSLGAPIPVLTTEEEEVLLPQSEMSDEETPHQGILVEACDVSAPFVLDIETTRKKIHLWAAS